MIAKNTSSIASQNNPNIGKRSVIMTEIEVMCSIGLHDFEKQAKQRVLIDLEVALDPAKEPSSDNVDDTLDYDMIREGVIAIASDRHHDLQETLARRILDCILAMKDVVGVIVMTSKPDVYPDCRSVSYRIAAGDI
ncbi:MAG: dihydroneopterin aldolase [Alphaproteobacteria bacterium]|nr:dihydroneopterin aldolase [Alphaproteobacteria bacterium]